MGRKVLEYLVPEVNSALTQLSGSEMNIMEVNKYAIQLRRKLCVCLICRILCLNARANPDFVVDVGDSPPQGFLFVYSSTF